MIFLKKIILPLFLVMILAGCEKDPAAPAYQREIVIYGFLWGNNYVTADRAISIKYSQPISELYNAKDAAVRNATVTITETAEGTVVPLFEDKANPGYYFNEQLFIQPGKRYQLDVVTNEKTASALTRVPSNALLLTELAGEDTTIVDEKNWGYNMPVVVRCDSSEQIFLTEMFCNEDFEDAEYIKPFHENQKYPQSREEYDGGVNGEPRRIQALVPYKDLFAPEFGEHVIFWYASMIVFKGSYTLTVAAIDNNYHDYLTKEHPVYSGGISGGIGVFGSLVGSQYPLYVTGYETMAK